MSESYANGDLLCVGQSSEPDIAVICQKADIPEEMLFDADAECE
jgi:hypothetical protein